MKPIVFSVETAIAEYGLAPGMTLVVWDGPDPVVVQRPVPAAPHTLIEWLTQGAIRPLDDTPLPEVAARLRVTADGLAAPLPRSNLRLI